MTTTWLRSRIVQVPNWPACSPHFHQKRKYVAHLESKAARKTPGCRAVRILQSDSFPLQNLLQLVSVFKCLQSVLWKKKRFLHRAICPNILEMCYCHQFKNNLFVMVSFLSLNMLYVLYFLLCIKIWFMRFANYCTWNLTILLEWGL